MSESRKIIRVFLASPGDLQDERKAAKAVVDEFNKLWADDLGYHVELVGWEDTISQYGRPQGTINQDLARCELVIGMIWKRWGTPPSKTGPFSSGFEEEFETSIASRREVGRPELALFFKAVDKELLRDPGEELKKVLTFKDGITAGKEICTKRLTALPNSSGKFELASQVTSRNCAEQKHRSPRARRRHRPPRPSRPMNKELNLLAQRSSLQTRRALLETS